MLLRLLKFVGIGAGIIVLAFGVLAGSRYLRYRDTGNVSERDAKRFVQEWERSYREDTVGGTTPEETLQLFIAALKNDDLDLASRYFVVDKQGEWKKELSLIREKGLIDEMVKDLYKLDKKYPLVEGKNDRFIFEAVNNRGELILQADIGRGSSGVWKIIDL